MANAEHPVIVLSAPSGAGKTTIANHLVDELPLRFATSATTRDPRPAEEHGEDYYFYTKDEFEQLADEGALLEYEEVHGEYYGTLVDELTSETPMLLDIDVKGALTVKDLYPGRSELFFIAPPSRPELRRRLRSRGDTEKEITRRLCRADDELAHKDEFDTVIVNDDLDVALQEAEKAVSSVL